MIKMFLPILALFAMAAIEARADTLVCQYVNAADPYPIALIFRESNRTDEDSIKEVDLIDGQQTVMYYGGTAIGINPTLIQCHLVVGNKDEHEKFVVNQFINMLKGGL